MRVKWFNALSDKQKYYMFNWERFFMNLNTYFLAITFLNAPFFLYHIVATIAAILSYSNKMCWPGYVVCYFGFFSCPVGVIVTLLCFIDPDSFYYYMLFHFLPCFGIAIGWILFWFWIALKKQVSLIDHHQE
jgi:hypothetical protein